MFDISLLNSFVTPIQKIDINSCDNNVNVYVKREDLLPFSFGGNKVRIAHEYYDDMKAQGKDCIIGYGNVRSNLCRVIANFSQVYQIPCHIVSPADETGITKTFNSRFVGLSGAEIHYCEKNCVAETIQTVIDACKAKGLKPYYINGDIYGKGNEATAVRAYIKVYEEIKRQETEQNIKFDYIFLATGTGTTQSGLLAGRKLAKGEETIVGISISRRTSVCESNIKEYSNAYLNQNGEPAINSDEIVVVDDYLCGGYGMYDDVVMHTINQVYSETGIAMDPCYSGKGFAGMLQYIKKHKLENVNVLFLHTGSAPLFFDYIEKHSSSVRIGECTDVQKLTTFLQEVDCCLPVALSKRVSVAEYANKVIRHGKVLCVEEKGVILSAALFYCNDDINHQAYLTLIATLPRKQKNGHAGALLKAVEEVSKSARMNTLHLDTDFNNTAAIAFYSKNEYKITSAGEKVHMTKELV